MVYYAALNKTPVEKLNADVDSLLSRQYQYEQEINYLNYVKPPNYQQRINQLRYEQSNYMSNFQDNLSNKLRPLNDDLLSCFQILGSIKEKEKKTVAPKVVETIPVINKDTPANKDGVKKGG